MESTPWEVPLNSTRICQGPISQTLGSYAVAVLGMNKREQAALSHHHSAQRKLPRDEITIEGHINRLIIAG